MVISLVWFSVGAWIDVLRVSPGFVFVVSQQVLQPRTKKAQGDGSAPINIELALETFLRTKPLRAENDGYPSLEKVTTGCSEAGISYPDDSSLDLRLWSFPLSNAEPRAKKAKIDSFSGRPSLLVEKISKQEAELIDMRHQLNVARDLIALKDTEIARLKQLIKTL